MFAHLSLPVLLLAFAAAGVAVWIAGGHLSDTTDVLLGRLGIGQALGGVVLLAVVTNLPEVAITVSAALEGRLDVATGNILGGIAIQTVVLVVLDAFGFAEEDALTYRAASLVLVLEGVLVLAELAAVVLGTQLPASIMVARVPPACLLVVVLWVVGLWLIGKAQKDLPWQNNGTKPPTDDEAEAKGAAKDKKDEAPKDSQSSRHQASTARTVLVFGAAAAATLVAGTVLERSGNTIAERLGISGVLFSATVLAGATGLTEISIGLRAIKLGNYQLAVSDVFGGNAFLPVLFLLASVVAGQSVLPHAGRSDLYLTALGMLLTCVYLYGLIFRPQRQLARLGIDSLLVLVLYVLGMVGLAFIGER